MKKPLAVSLAFVGVLGSAAWADEARIPIFQPTTITEAGHYILTRDLSVASGDAITIMTDNVTLDLNGRTIQSAPSYSAVVVGGGFHGIVVRNGRLLGGFFGVNGFASATATIGLRVEGVEARGSTGAGVNVTNAGMVEVISSRLTDTGFGIFIRSPTGATFGGRIVDNVVDNTGSTAVALQTPRGVEVRRNVITRFGTAASVTSGLLVGSGSTGTDAGGNIVADNVVRGSDDDLGILVGNGTNNLIANNVISALGSFGLDIYTSGNRIVGNVVSACLRGLSLEAGANRNTVERNHFEGNKEIGISVASGYNLIDSNVSEGNTSWGIQFSTGVAGNAYRDNMLRSNGAGAVNGSATDAGGNIL